MFWSTLVVPYASTTLNKYIFSCHFNSPCSSVSILRKDVGKLFQSSQRVSVKLRGGWVIDWQWNWDYQIAWVYWRDLQRPSDAAELYCCRRTTQELSTPSCLHGSSVETTQNREPAVNHASSSSDWLNQWSSDAGLHPPPHIHGISLLINRSLFSWYTQT